MKKLLAVFSLLLALVVLPSITNAQAVNLPGVYVRDLILNKTDYKAGDNVTGSFSLLNTEKTVVPNIYYMIFLMGDYKNTIPQTQYDRSEMVGPFNLASGESRTVNFSYRLPVGVSGTDLGIQAHATMKNGAGLGWSDSMIKITGGTSFLKFSSAYVEVGKDKFGLQDGPMVYGGEKISLNTVFKNDSNSSIEAIPEIKIYNRSEVGGLLKTFSESKVTVKPKSDLSLKIDLPTFGYDPKVYVGTLNLLNSAGEKVAPATDFRYIVNGDIVTINSVTSNVESVGAGETLVLAVNYSGSPFDIMSGKISTTTPADLNVKVFNQKNILIGEYTDKTDFNKGNQKLINLTATQRAKAIRVEATASKGNKILASYSAVLSKDFAKAQTESDWSDFFTLKNISLIFLIIIAIVVIFLVRKSPNRKITILFTLIVILILAIIFIYIGSVKAWTQNSFSQWGDGNIYNVFVNSPSGSYNPGQQFYLQISASAQACSNRIMSLFLSAGGELAIDPNCHDRGDSCQIANWHAFHASGGRQATVVTRDQYKTYTLSMSNYSIGPFTAPSTPGTQSVNFNLLLNNYDNSNGALLSGYQNYSVSCPNVPVTTVTVAASSTCEGGLVVSWSAVSGAVGGYAIYKDGSATALATVSSSVLSYNDTSVGINSSHSYTVKALSACGSSNASASVSGNAAPMCPVPSAPITSLTAYPSNVPGQCGGKIDLSWFSVPHASYYNVIRYSPLSGDVENISSTTATTFRDSVSPGSVHKYAIQAFNAISQSQVSSLQMATSTYDCTPNMVTSCYATQNGLPVLNAAEGRVVWVAPIAGGVEPYNFHWIDSRGGSFSPGITDANTSAQATTTYSNSGTNPISNTVTISTNSGEGAYYRTASASCNVYVWNTIHDLALKNFNCNVAPSSGSVTLVNQPINWRVTVPLDLVASTSISWMGTNGLSGTTAIVTKTYNTVGLKNASVTVFGKDSSGRAWQGTCSTSTSVESGGGFIER